MGLPTGRRVILADSEDHAAATTACAGTRFFDFQGKFWMRVGAEESAIYIEHSKEVPEPRDPDGRWGKFKYLAEPGD